MHFTHAWAEHATLQDGTRVVLRLIRPEDKDALRAGFERLSPESRYLRFHTPKARLTDDELRYLCEVDQQDHVAIGAQRDDGAGVGIARFVRLPDAPDAPEAPPTAEAAIAVSDDAHGRGLGKLLLLRLIAAAHERGIARFRCEVLASNATMQQLIAQFAPAHAASVASGVLSFDYPLPEVAPDAPISAAPPAGPMYEVLRAAAGQTVEVLNARPGSH
jgi:GNAT superfamily N-acetyltransferase